MMWYYCNIKQRKDQSVKKYVNYLDELKAQMEPFTDTQHCDHFMTDLKSEIALAIAEHTD